MGINKVKLKPFNLKQWIQAGNKNNVFTKGNLKVISITIFSEVKDGKSPCIAGIVKQMNPPRHLLLTWNEDGQYQPSEMFHEFDLMV